MTNQQRFQAMRAGRHAALTGAATPCPYPSGDPRAAVWMREHVAHAADTGVDYSG